MHANIQAICSGTFVIQTSHMACSYEKKKIKHGKTYGIVNTDMVCKQLQNWKIYVFAVNVFLLITNALACHLLQCSAHVTCCLF